MADSMADWTVVRKAGCLVEMMAVKRVGYLDVLMMADYWVVLMAVKRVGSMAG